MIGLGTTKAERGLHSIGLDSFDVLTLAHGIRKAYAVSEKVKRETRLGVTRKADAESLDKDKQQATEQALKELRKACISKRNGKKLKQNTLKIERYKMCDRHANAKVGMTEHGLVQPRQGMDCMLDLFAMYRHVTI